MIGNSVIVLRLIMASILGGFIGLEREANNRPAGFRTHILVTLGSALMMLVSIDMGKSGADPARIAAQVVSGIGFLGAGTILRTGNNIEGLTTAASLWVCSGIGLSMGNGYYLGGVTTTVIVLFFLRSSRRFERIILRGKHKVVKVVGHTRPGLIGDIGTLFGNHNISIRDISIESIEEEEDYREEIHFTIRSLHNIEFDTLIDDMYRIEGVEEVILYDREIKKD